MPTKKDKGGVLIRPEVSEDMGDKDPAATTIDFKIDEAAQALIGHHLRTLYGEIVREPVPDQLLKLLADLERKEQQ